MPSTVHQPISWRSEFRAQIVNAMNQAADTGCAELWDFADWPLNDPVLIDALVRWGFAHRKLTMLAHHFDEVVRRHPRWVQWRRQWAHIVECRELPELEPQRVPSLFLAPGLISVKLVDSSHFRGLVTSDPADLIQVRESIEAVLQRSTPGFPAVVTGL
jgi:hypothetical protein